MDKIKLLVNGNFLTYPFTGVPRHALEICRSLQKLGLEIEVLAPQSGQVSPISDELNTTCVGKRSGFLWEQIDLPKYLKKLGSPLLLNLCNTAPMFYSNQIVTIHDLAFIANPQWFSARARIALKLIVPTIVKRAKLVATDSEFSKQEILKFLKVNRGDIHVIHPASSFQESLFASEERFPFFKQPYLLSVSSLNPRKNLQRLLRAYKEVRRTQKIPLVLIGETASAFGNIDEVKELMATSDIIHIPRVTDSELSLLYSKARLLIYPSLYEGFGLPPLEALELGCLPVVSDIPPHNEVCGSQAIYFDPYSVHDMARKIHLGLQTNLDKKEAQKQVSKFSWDRSAQKLLEAAKPLLSPQSSIVSSSI